MRKTSTFGALFLVSAIALFAPAAVADTPVAIPSPAPGKPESPVTAPTAPPPLPSAAPDGDAEVAAAPASATESEDNPEIIEKKNRRTKDDASWWPSLLVEPGAGAVVAPSARGGATFGFSVGVVRLSVRGESNRVSSLFAWHAGYTLAPGVNRGEATFTAGTGVSGGFVLALRAGPTMDTNGNFGVRAGVRGTLYHALGLELFMHHGFQPRNDTSVFMVLTVDMVPATMLVLFIGALGNLFK